MPKLENHVKKELEGTAGRVYICTLHVDGYAIMIWHQDYKRDWRSIQIIVKSRNFLERKWRKKKSLISPAVKWWAKSYRRKGYEIKTIAD